MVATAPGEKLLIRRRPVRKWTQQHWQSTIQMVTRTISSYFLCRKLHLFLGKSTKTAATRAALFDSNMHQIVCQLGIRLRPHWGSSQRSPRPLAVFREPTSKGKGGKRRGGAKRGDSSSFALGRTKKSRRLCLGWPFPVQNINIFFK